MKRRRLVNLAKYFVHGIPISLFLFGLVTYLGLFLSILGRVPFSIGIIIGAAVLMIIVGVGNSLVARVLWFRMKGSWRSWRSWLSYLAHGIYLLIVLLVANLLLQFLLNYALSTVISSASTVVGITYGILVLLNGYIGMHIAASWQAEAPRVLYTSDTFSAQNSAAAVKVKKRVPILIGEVRDMSPDERLRLEEARLDELLEHRKRTDILNPAALDQVIDEQKRKIEELRKSIPISR